MDCELVSVTGSFNQSITNSTNMGNFCLSKAGNGSVNFADHFNINEVVIDPHIPMSSWGQVGLGTAGTTYNFLADDGTGASPTTGSFGVQSFSEGDKISGSMTVSSSVNTSIRGSFTFIFRTTGGLAV